MADPSDISQEPPPSDPAFGFNPDYRPPAFEPIEQAPTPAPVPVTGPQILIEEQEEPTPIDDETAWRYVETTGPDTAPAELDIRKREMAGYYAAKEEEDRQREAIYYEEAYTNEKKRREILDRPEVAQARIGAKDPKLVETAAINNAYLEYLIGRKLDPSELEAQRHEMGRRMFGDPSMSHDAFAAAVKGQFEHKQQERVGLTDLRANVFDDVWNNKYTTGGDTFMRWRDAHDDILNDQNEKPFYWYSRKQAETFYKAADRIKEPGSLVLDAVQTYLAGPGEDPQHEQKLNQKFVAAGEAMLALDPKDRALVWQGVKYVTDSKKVETGVVETIVDNIRKALIERGIVGAATDVNMQGQDMKLEDTRQYLLGGDVRVRNSDGLPAVIDPSTMPLGSAERETAERYLATQTRQATPEETSDLLRKTNTAIGALQMLREGKDILQREIDPYRPVTPDVWWMRKTEMGAYNLIESAPTMVLNAVPIVGQSLMALSFASHDYNEMLLRDPNMDKRIASAGSIVSGQVQAVLEHFQIESMLGKSQLKRMLGDLRAGNFQTVARNFGILFAEQNLQEAAQDFTSMFVPWLASQFRGAEMKPRDFGVEFDEFLKQRVDVAFALLIPTLVGTGVASWTDLKNPARDLFDERMMNNAGFSPEARARILAQATLEERIAAYQEEWKKRTPEDIAAGYASTAAEIDRVNGHQTDPATPTMENRPLADGTADWHVLDAEGNTVFHSKDYDVALDQYALHAERILSARIAAQQEAAASEEGQAATAEAEGALRVLEPESRTSAAYLLEFDDEPAPTPERAAAVARLEAALAADPRSGGKPVKLIPVTRRVGAATVSGQKLNETIDSLSRLFGKDVVFVRSGTGEDLPFTGIVNPSDPNTIFLDAAGDRNVLALIGHEWSHTLKLTNPQLHAAMVAQMRPLVFEWLNQEAKLREGEGYTEAQVTDELVGNIIGDAFTRPEFMRLLAQRNPSLFERVVKAIQEFFNSLIAAARGSEWATEGFITDLEAMHDVIASTIEQARMAGPEVAGMAAQGELSFAGRRKVEQGFYRKVDEVVDAKLPNVSTAQQAKATINSAGLKAEEIKWTGVIPAIDEIAKANNGKVPKAELERYLENEGKVKLEEVTLGDEADLKRIRVEQEKYDEIILDYNRQIGEATDYEITVRDLVSGFKKPADLPSKARELWDARTTAIAEREAIYTNWVETRGPAPKFGSYTLPGAENYREVVLSMPEVPPERIDTTGWTAEKMTPVPDQFNPEVVPMYRVFDKEGRLVTQPFFAGGMDEAAAIKRATLLIAGRRAKEARYTSSHFPDIPNYVAHMRLNDRTDANGNPGTFLEELQSDRHQQGREKGYKEDVTYTEEDLAKEGLSIEFRKAGQRYVIVDEFGNAFGEGQTKPAAIADLAKTRATTRIADAPFRKDWPLALFKRALRDAVSFGHKWIGWTTGDTQAERYDLSKQVESIRLSGDFDQEIEVSIVRAGREEYEHLQTTTKDKLQDVVGKDIAKKAIEEEQRVFRGLDLKVGGEGMKGFYDKILPNEIGKYVKQWGGKVEKVERSGMAREQLNYYFERRLDDGQWHRAGAIGGAETLEEAQAKVDDMNARGRNTWRVAKADFAPVPIWRIEITPQMKEGVAAGQLQFATRRGKAAQAAAEGISREESVAAAFERMHAGPTERLALLKRIKTEYQRVRAANAAAEAAAPAPQQVDPTEKLNELEAQETKALEDIDVEEQDALDRSSQQIAERYADRILAEQDIDARRALERESKNVAAAQRKGIEKQFGERRKAIEADFRRQQQAVTVQAEQANLAATQEGAAQLAEMRRIHAFAELNALVKALPPEIRGRIGGALTLAQVRTTETSLTDFLTKRIAMIDRELERAFRAEYRERIDQLLERAKPEGKAGERPKGKIGVEAHRVVNDINEIIDMSPDQVEARKQSLLDQIAAAEADDTGKLADLVERLQITEIFGGLDARLNGKTVVGAEGMARAHDFLKDVYDTGRAKAKALEAERVANIKQMRESAKRDTGKKGTDPELDARIARDKKLVHQIDGIMPSLLSFENIVQIALGKESALGKQFVERERNAKAQKRRGILQVHKEFRDLMVRVFPNIKSPLGRERERWKMQQREHGITVTKMEGIVEETIDLPVEKARQIVAGEVRPETFGLSMDDVSDIADMLAENDAKPANRQKDKFRFDVVTNKGTPTDMRLSQFEAIHMSMLWAQDRYKPAMRRHGWTDATMAELENKLTPEAKQIRAWFAQKYDQGHASINEVFKRMFGMDLPKEANYAPGTFEAEGAELVETDPYGHGMIPEGGMAAKFLVGRKTHKAIPRIEDAYNVFLGHVAQTEHWKAYAELTRDMRSVFSNPEVSRAVRAKAGKNLFASLQGWMVALERNGIKARSFFPLLDNFFRRFQSVRARLGLAWNVGTMMKQSSALFSAMADVPGVDYWKGFAKLLAGQLETRKIWNSPMIQDRVAAGYSPEARMALESMFNSAPNISSELVEKGMSLLGNIDAFFTTGSAAISYDYHYRQAKAGGASDVQANELAMKAAERTVFRTAQPAEMTDRSLFELGLSPFGRSAFMFMSELRQKLALEYMAFRHFIKGEKGAGKQLAQTLFLMHVLIPLTIQGITSMWRDMRDDDDDEVFDFEHWNPLDFLVAMTVGPLAAIPGLTDLIADKGYPTEIQQMASAAMKVMKDGWPEDDEQAVLMTRKLMTGLGWALGVAGRPEGELLGVAAKDMAQVYQITDNFVGEPED